MRRNAGKILAFLCLFLANGWAADSKIRKLSIADILADSRKLEGTTVEIHGRIVLSDESSFIEDDSKCKGPFASRCKLSAAIGRCRVSGEEYSGLECGGVLRRLFEGERRDSQKWLVLGVVVRGVLTTKRKDPRIGFGHLGAFPAEITITELKLRNK